MTDYKYILSPLLFGSLFLYSYSVSYRKNLLKIINKRITIWESFLDNACECSHADSKHTDSDFVLSGNSEIQQQWLKSSKAF